MRAEGIRSRIRPSAPKLTARHAENRLAYALDRSQKSAGSAEAYPARFEKWSSNSFDNRPHYAHDRFLACFAGGRQKPQPGARSLTPTLRWCTAFAGPLQVFPSTRDVGKRLTHISGRWKNFTRIVRSAVRSLREEGGRGVSGGKYAAPLRGIYAGCRYSARHHWSWWSGTGIIGGSH